MLGQSYTRVFAERSTALALYSHQRFPVTKYPLVGEPHSHSTGTCRGLDLCPRGSGLMQRLIHELDTGWLQVCV
jgi:hypothetical protein